MGLMLELMDFRELPSRKQGASVIHATALSPQLQHQHHKYTHMGAVHRDI